MIFNKNIKLMEKSDLRENMHEPQGEKRDLSTRKASFVFYFLAESSCSLL